MIYCIHVVVWYRVWSLRQHQGLGVFTAEAIQPHELVAEYVGERIKLSEAERRTEAYRKGKIAVSP